MALRLVVAPLRSRALLDPKWKALISRPAAQLVPTAPGGGIRAISTWHVRPNTFSTARAAATPALTGSLAKIPLAVGATQQPQLQSLLRPAAPALSAIGGIRAMSTWRLRPYAAAGGIMAVTPLSTLSGGFSKVGLSLLVMPWKALPMALVIAPVVWGLPAIYRFVFTNSARGATASAFSALLHLTIAFMPAPCFENLFSDFAFYSVALVSTFFFYMFFPEIFLNDYMLTYYVALFTIPIIPLAFTYMPIMHVRSYLFL